MATVQTLGSVGDTIDLSDISKHAILLNGLSIRQVRARTVIPISGRDAARLAYSQAQHLEIAATVAVTGADHNTIVTNWRNIIDKLRKARLYALSGVGSPVEFRWQWENATAGVAFDVIDGDFPPPPDLTHPWAGSMADCRLVLICLPYGRSTAAVTAASGTITNASTGYTPAAVVGDAPARLRLRIQNKQASTTMNFIRAAIRSRGTPANFVFPITPAVTQSGITIALSSGAADAGAYVTMNGVSENLEYVRVTINANVADHFGAFRVHLRILGTQNETVQLRWAGPTGSKRANTAVALGATGAYHVVDVGVMNIPEQERASDLTISSFVFSIWRGTGLSDMRLEAIELWPAEEYIEWEDTTGPAENEYAVIDSLGRQPTAFLANSSGEPINTLAHAGIAPQLQVGSNRILARASRSRLDARDTDSLAVDVRYFPSWDYQRGSA